MQAPSFHASLAALLVAAGAAGVASAGEKQPHFIVEQPQSYREAQTRLYETLEPVRSAIARGDMGKVHEISYTMEAALARMQADLAALHEQIEAMHLASERQREAEVAAAFSDIKQRVEAMLGVPVAD